MLQLLNKSVLLFIIIFIISCTSIENKVDDTKKIDKVDIEKIASGKFGEEFTLDYNISKEFLICKKRNKSIVAGNLPIKYFIYDLNKNQIIEENTIPLGNISWISEFDVRIEIHSGMIQKNVEPNKGYILNVKTNLKTTIIGEVH